MDAKAPLSSAQGKRKLNLRIFIDRSVLEVFANETMCVTKIISPLEINFIVPQVLGYYKEEGLEVELLPLGSNAAVMAALQVAQSLQSGVVVTVLPDGGSRYQSDKFWEAK